jgi:hypothetical protein
LDINDEFSLCQLAAQVLVLAGQHLDAPRLCQRGVDLAAAFLWFQGRLFSAGSLLAPSG